MATTNRHYISGHESWSADEIADVLTGNLVPVGDTEGLHGAVIVLARRVAEQRTEIDDLKRQHESAISRLTRKIQKISGSPGGYP